MQASMVNNTSKTRLALRVNCCDSNIKAAIKQQTAAMRAVTLGIDFLAKR